MLEPPRSEPAAGRLTEVDIRITNTVYYYYFTHWSSATKEKDRKWKCSSIQNQPQSLSRSSWPVFRSQWPESFYKQWQIQTNLLSGELKKEDHRQDAADGLLSALVEDDNKTGNDAPRVEDKLFLMSDEDRKLEPENQQVETLKGGRVSLGFHFNNLLKVSEELIQPLLDCKGLFTGAETSWLIN